MCRGEGLLGWGCGDVGGVRVYGSWVVRVYWVWVVERGFAGYGLWRCGCGEGLRGVQG